MLRLALGVARHTGLRHVLPTTPAPRLTTHVLPELCIRRRDHARGAAASVRCCDVDQGDPPCARRNPGAPRQLRRPRSRVSSSPE